jgi:alkylation response protein AidB-like acyl-CoA dehydrogenase
LTKFKEYWMEHDNTGEYPHELHRDLAKDGWIGIALPEELGGAGLGISEATVSDLTILGMMHLVNLMRKCTEHFGLTDDATHYF